MLLKKLSFYRAFLIGLCFIASLSCEDDDVREVTLYDKGTVEVNASTTSIAFGETVTFSETSTKVNKLEWSFPGGSPDSSTESNVTVTYSTPGSFDATLEVTYIDNQTETKTFKILVEGPDEPLPFGDTPVSLPGVIEAENYDLGGQGVAYNDTEEENLAVSAGSPTYRADDGIDIEVSDTRTNIGYTNADEWANYTVEVANAGPYDFDFQVASGSDDGGKSLKIQLLNQDTGVVSDLGETGDFPNTGGWGTYTSLVASGINLPAGTQTIRIFFTGGGTNVDNFTVTESSTQGGGGVPLGPLNIAIATNNVDNEAGYIAALELAGHTVEAISQKYENLDASGVATLNGFDLVIISRNNNSGTYGTDPGVRANWMSVTTPVIIISPYVARTSRLQLFDNDNGIDGVGSSLDAVIATHPVFTGIDLTSGNTGDITTSGLHVVDTPSAGNGTIIATTGGANYVTLAEWNANTEFYAGSSMAAGKRMFMAASGTYDFNDIGTKYFLNVVEYIVSGSVYVEGVDTSGGSTDPGKTLGFYTERITDENNLATEPENNANYIITTVTNAAEGSEAIYAQFDAVNSDNPQTYGAMLTINPTTAPFALAEYGFMNISLKAPTENTKNIRLRFNTNNGNYWVTLSTADTDAIYGMVRDGQWHTLKIPFGDIKLNGDGLPLDVTTVEVSAFRLRTDDADFDITANYDWYLDDIYFSQN